jgi:hypothetical protein
MVKLIATVMLLLHASIADAAYIPTSSFSGVKNNTFTSQWVKNIVAMRDKDGALYNLPSRYEDVSSCKGGVCRITVKSDDSGGNLLGILTNKAFQKAFYLVKEGEKYVDVDINELIFKCIETK